tara:strand:- start:607 stop:1218 length:612 start_codon:yes stop_codon:yes gene_type:complete
VQLGLTVTVLFVLFLTVTGRLHWIGAALTGALVLLRQLLPLIIRFIPTWLSYRGSSIGSSSSKTSTVASRFLRMNLDHETGKMSGQVLEGEFEHWELDEMERSQLESLLSYCSKNDPDSARLLESYLTQRFPDESFDNQQSYSESSSQMQRAEALSILGLEGEPDSEAIVNAHRHLMQKLHPDRGGNDYLAAKINQAKDILLS